MKRPTVKASFSDQNAYAFKGRTSGGLGRQIRLVAEDAAKKIDLRDFPHEVALKIESFLKICWFKIILFHIMFF